MRWLRFASPGHPDHVCIAVPLLGIMPSGFRPRSIMPAVMQAVQEGVHIFAGSSVAVLSHPMTDLLYVPAGPSEVPITANPMFGSDILDTQGSDVNGQAPRRNPVWECRSRMSPQGANPNPLYGSGEDILASRDSLGAMRNPVWESHSAEAPSGDSNPLFGTGVLDTTDSLTGENPLYETPRSHASRRRPQGQH